MLISYLFEIRFLIVGSRMPNVEVIVSAVFYKEGSLSTDGEWLRPTQRLFDSRMAKPLTAEAESWCAGGSSRCRHGSMVGIGALASFCLWPKKVRSPVTWRHTFVLPSLL